MKKIVFSIFLISILFVGVKADLVKNRIILGRNFEYHKMSKLVFNQTLEKINVHYPLYATEQHSIDYPGEFIREYIVAVDYAQIPASLLASMNVAIESAVTKEKLDEEGENKNWWSDTQKK